MTGTTLTPQSASNLVSLNIGGGAGPQLSASFVNSFRVTAVAERLLNHVQSGFRGDVMEFFNLCLSLARGIDYAVANNEVPAKASDLPSLLRQICQRKNNDVLVAAVMVLMISVKNACRTGWFSEKESEELFSLANEIGSRFCGSGDITTASDCSLSIVDKVIERYYPTLKMGQTLASLEVKPGYGTYVLDFHISKSTGYATHEKIRLFVAQTDNIETSSCIISPQQVNFLLNGKGVDKRITSTMDTGSQLPTNVTGMLKYGTNLLQAVGQFNGHYIIVIAFMSIASSIDPPVLKDYVQPIEPSSKSDTDIVEGPSRISLNCPISFTRIQTPVKGHLCKHLQCFDFRNYITMNIRRPRWRCPHCDQYVCYLDIRVDQNIVKVLREVGENVSKVNISVDGSWKVSENDDDDLYLVDKLNETSEMDEATPGPSVMDLTNDDDTEMASACEPEDVKPLSNTNTAQVENDFWSGVYLANCTSYSGPSSLQPSLLSDAVSLALNREAGSHGNTDFLVSAMHNQLSTPNYVNSQLLQSANSTASNEYGTSQTLPRELASGLPIGRTPTAVQALPALSQTLGVQQRPRTSFNNPAPNSASLTSHAGQSITSKANVLSGICSDLERQQYFARPQMNPVQVSGIASSSLQHGSRTTQNCAPQDRSFTHGQSVVGHQVPSQLQSASRVSSGLQGFTNAHLDKTFNSRTPPAMSQSPRVHTLRSHVRQGSAQVGINQAPSSLNNQQSFTVAAQRAAMARQSSPMPAQNQTPRTRPSLSVNAGGFRGSAGDRRGNIGGPVQAVSGADELVDSPSEQNWRPTGRMRGSLSGQAYTAALNKFIIRPTPPTEKARPASHLTPPSHLTRPPHLTSPPAVVPSQLPTDMSSQLPQMPTSQPL
ncbi:hypothetical protein ACLB2K_043678 [Fragaria x ananassa]